MVQKLLKTIYQISMNFIVLRKINVFTQKRLENHPRLQKTPSKIKFEGVFLTFRSKNALKYEKRRFALPCRSRYRRSTEVRAFIKSPCKGQGDERVS